MSFVQNAIQTALNALSILEEESPEQSARLRRLLPALSAHFARSGYHPTENELLSLVHDSRENGVDLRSYFKSATPEAPQSPYEAILKRLTQCENDSFLNEETIFNFGRVDLFKKVKPQRHWIREDYLDAARNAAILGHADLCHEILSLTHYDEEIFYDCLTMAAQEGQYHVATRLFRDVPFSDMRDFLFFRDALPPQKLASFSKFCDLKHYFRKTQGRDFDESCLTSLEFLPLSRIPMKPYLDIRRYLSREIGDVRKLNSEGVKAAILFQSPDRFFKMLDKWGQSDERPMTRLLSEMIVPLAAKADWPRWGDALLKHGMKMSHLLFFVDKVPAPVTNEAGNISFRRTAHEVWKNTVTRPERINGADAQKYNGRLRTAFREASDIWRKHRTVQEPKPTKAIPPLDIDGAEFGLKDHRLRKCGYDNPRILFLGYFTGCCEKIGDDFQATIQHALSTKESGFYIVEKDEEIIAHSWIWRGQSGQLVIDGWESKAFQFNNAIARSLTFKIAEILETPAFQPYGIREVQLGLSGKNLIPETGMPSPTNPAERFLVKRYYPPDKQDLWLVRQWTPRLKF